MKQAQFVSSREPEWEKLTQYIEDNSNATLEDHAKFPRRFRELCQSLSIARSRNYSEGLRQRLNKLVVLGHHQLYRPRKLYGRMLLDFLFEDFPRCVRQHKWFVALSSLFFFGTFFGMFFGIQWMPELVYAVVPADMVSQMEYMYDPSSEVIGEARDAESNIYMAGFYLYNNTSIGFRVFASGLLLGIGSILQLVFNGLYIGAIAGHLTEIGYSKTFWSFVSGHSAFELMAIVLSGAAGLKIGLSLVIPGRRTRLGSLLHATKTVFPMVVGFALMFFAAAFIEGFWSSMGQIPALTKYIVGIVLWVFTLSYFVFFGRRSDGLTKS